MSEKNKQTKCGNTAAADITPWWPASLAYSGSSRLVTEPISRSEVDDPLADPLDLRTPRVGGRQAQACLGQASLDYRYVVERWENRAAELFMHHGEKQN